MKLESWEEDLALQLDTMNAARDDMGCAISMGSCTIDSWFLRGMIAVEGFISINDLNWVERFLHIFNLKTVE
jgi:hypothetical protein